MWKVGDVEPVRVMGAEGYPYGFNVTTEDGKSVVSFAYASRALAEAAATHLESALLNAISVIPTQNKRAFRHAELSKMHRAGRLANSHAEIARHNSRSS